MKFIHLADCHLGGWRDQKLRDLNLESFNKVINAAIDEKVDFVLIAGDLFNTSVPSIESLKGAVTNLKKLKDADIPVYGIAGSHDFSPSGKTMLDILEKAGLFTNVGRYSEEKDKVKLSFTVDKKTGVKLTGLFGKKGMLDIKLYKRLDKAGLETEPGFKIFLFHTGITEYKPKEFAEMGSIEKGLLPRGFDYYAGGHIHYLFNKDNKLAFPGPTFPNNFKELEELKHGTFCLYNEGELKHVGVKIAEVFSSKFNCDDKTPDEVREEIIKSVKDKDFSKTIVMLRLEGILKEGKPRDIRLNEIMDLCYDQKAYFVMKKTTALTSKEFKEIKIEHGSVEEVEDKIIKEHLGQISINLNREEEEKLTKTLINLLNTEKQEGERVADFEERVVKNVEGIL